MIDAAFDLKEHLIARILIFIIGATIFGRIVYRTAKSWIEHGRHIKNNVIPNYRTLDIEHFKPN